MCIVTVFSGPVNQYPYFLEGFCLASCAAILPEYALPALWISPVAVKVIVPPVLDGIDFALVILFPLDYEIFRTNVEHITGVVAFD